MTLIPTKPILQFKNHQLIHRPDDEYTTLEQSLNNKPFLLFVIGIPADIAVMVAVLALFKQVITTIGVPLAIMLVFLYAVSNKMVLFVLKFKLISAKQQSQKNTNAKKPFGIFDWIAVCILSVLGCLLFYLYVYAKLPADSYELIVLKFAILAVAIPYYAYRAIKVYQTLFL